MIDLLRRLSEAFGPSGCEERVRQLLIGELQHVWDAAETDPLGNLIVSLGESLPGPKAMIAAHMDEVGFIVDHIDDGGYLRFKKVGGIDDRILPSTRVRVGGRHIPGVIGIKPRHLATGAEKEQVVKADDLYVDIGVKSKEEAESFVQLGDYMVFDTPFHASPAGFVTGKALDDRAGCALAVALAKGGVPMRTDLAFTVQEEIGLRGAKAAVARVKPDFAIVLEATTCADMPDPSSRHRSTRLGDGPVLTFQDATSIPHPGLLRLLVETATEEQIPFQWKQTTAGGNDAGSIHVAEGGIPTVSISLPCRYLHAPCSLLAVSDIEHTLRLLRALLDRIARDGLPDRA